MQRPIERREQEVFHPKQDVALARRLSERLRQQFGELVKAVILHQPEHKGFHHPDSKGPLILTVILDDVTEVLDQSMLERYASDTRKLIERISTRFKVKSMRLSAFWRGTKELDPRVMAVLRNGISLHDKGFFAPMQQLLFDGRIKPTYEAMGIYAIRTQKTIKRADEHILQACVDLYWATIDAAHAVLMRHGEMPPSPKTIAATMKARLVPKRIVSDADCKVMKEMLDLYKGITHRQVTRVTGSQFDQYLKKVEIFVKRMGKALDHG